jgi:hypothetical protein
MVEQAPVLRRAPGLRDEILAALESAERIQKAARRVDKAWRDGHVTTDTVARPVGRTGGRA